MKNRATTELNCFESPLYSTSIIKEIEDKAAEYTDTGLSVLMERAGTALFEFIQSKYPQQTPWHIVCGTGNNAGDGYVLARLAVEKGVKMYVYCTGVPKANDASMAYQAMLATGIEVTDVEALSPQSGVIVDCILGTGLESAPRKPWPECIKCINNCELPVISADVPTGLSADTGHAYGEVVNADATITFLARKPGLYTGDGRGVSGEITLASLDVEADTSDVRYFKMTASMFSHLLPPRPVNAHKGLFGHVLVIGGDSGFAGAALMSATSALRSGAGLVSVITHPRHASALVARRPELMVNGLMSPSDNPELGKRLVSSADVIVIGPGLGTAAFGRSWFEFVLEHTKANDKAMVLDADALNLLAEAPIEVPAAVLTPHPGEACRLLGVKTADVGRHRFNAVHRLHEKYQAPCLLKGAGSLVSDGEITLVCDRGNPGMSSGGMGDVLAGVVAALAAQGLSMFDALSYAVWLHATAGDIAARKSGQVGLLASDLIDEVRQEINQ